MERKRKMPPRAAARAEQVAKKRTATPPDRSATGTPAPEADSMVNDEVVTPVPKSVQAGKPLPTVETPQPDELSNKDFQSIIESGVLAESLTRSRQKWISEGIFEKYWTKPSRKKGAVKEDNPPKESMVKLGQVTITVEPHVFEATMFSVHAKPVPATQAQRPVLQYGPPNGIMPPPQTPTPKPSVAAQTATAGLQPDAKPGCSGPVSAAQDQAPQLPPAQNAASPPPAPVPAGSLSTPAASPLVPATTTVPTGAVPISSGGQTQPINMPTSATAPAPAPIGRPPVAPSIQAAATGLTNPTANGPAPAAPVGKPPPSRDPIILTLAEKAGEDPHLRDLMKRVANGDAAKHELESFQAIIDRITAESKRQGPPVGPPADRLFVDNRTVRYFADEVRAILDIVLKSNPKQTSADLRPPPGSDPLVVMLVKAALDDVKVSELVKRIAENRPLGSDASDLKATLDRLNGKISRSPASPCPAVTSAPKMNGSVNGHGHVAQASASAKPAPAANTPQQALRSRGPPPALKTDISAVVFEFAGGNGDRYLFPKFSILEYVPLATGQQVIASFLVVLKGSKSEYPVADAALDYYQPVTIRLYTPLGRHLENLARVVAPQDEVRRYMDDVMDKMTRAEYVLLAIRLPRSDPGNGDGPGGDEADAAKGKEHRQDGAVTTPKQGFSQLDGGDDSPTPQVLWTSKPSKADAREPGSRAKIFGRTSDVQDEEYQNFIASVSQKRVDEV